MEYSMKAMVNTLVKLNEIQWGGYAFYHEPLERKFTAEQKQEYICCANRCGRMEAEKLWEEYAGYSVGEMAKALGFDINTLDLPTGGGHVVFAQYVEPKEIIIFRDCIEKAEIRIREEGLEKLFEGISLEDVLTAHELFHGIEYNKRKWIYTQTEKIELWRKPFSNKSKILCLSEMAAMAFAKELLGMSFSPYVLDVLLMYGYHAEAAQALFEEILEAAGIRERGKEC